MNKENILEIKNLSIKFPVQSGIFLKKKNTVEAVDRVNLELKIGEILGLVGESGCGKSTVAKAIIKILRFASPNVKIEGNIFFRTEKGEVDLLSIKTKEARKYRGLIQIIFQDPFSSLNPRMTIGRIIEEPLLYHTGLQKKERTEKVIQLLKKVGMQEEHINRYPHEFSGGQRQRVGIARALTTNPALIIADEPVSALDVSIQAQIINLLQELQSEFGLSILFIAHDLSVVQHISSRIAVMYLGTIVELGQAKKVYHNPQHPYSKALLSAVPLVRVKDSMKDRIILSGDLPTPLNKPSGCVFRTRCPIAKEECSVKVPELEKKDNGSFAACYFV